MKLFWTLFAGFLLGAALALTALYFNPMIEEGGTPPEVGDTILHYASPVNGELLFTQGGLSRLPMKPVGVVNLWESTIVKSALAVIVLRDAEGAPTAIASRVSYPSEDTELLFSGALLKDAWLVSMPGRGSLYVNAESNWWPLLKDALIPVWYLGRQWQGPAVYEPTIGPAPGRRAVVAGATGVFSDRRGTGAERYRIGGFDNRVGPVDVDAELYWRFDEPVAAAPAD